jgi:hypothetical protein
LKKSALKWLSWNARIVEVDETYIGGKEINKHETTILKAGRGAVGKTPVFGMRERVGRTVATPVIDVCTGTVDRVVH